MDGTLAPIAPPDPSPPLPRAQFPLRRIQLPLFLLLVAAVAFTFIAIADRRLRQREKLAMQLMGHDPPVMIPFSDFLQDRVQLKYEWNKLLAARSAAAGNPPKYADAIYALSSFIEKHIAPLDERRRTFLLELINRYPDRPETISAYIELLRSDWNPTMSPSHPAYTHKLLDLSRREPGGGKQVLLTLDGVLSSNNEPLLERQVLRRLQKSVPIDPDTAPAMSRLLALLDPSDPDRPNIQAELATYKAWRETILAEAKWYGRFAAAASKASTPELERLRREPPASSSDAFTASADAQLIQRYLREGRFDEAYRLRRSFADCDLNNLDIDGSIASELLIPREGPPPSNLKGAPPPAALPDAYHVKVEKWRQLLASGRHDEARALAATLFVDDLRSLARPAADLAAASRGTFNKLAPRVVLASPAGPLPPEIAGDRDVCTGVLELRPGGAAIPGNIKTHIEIWVTRDHVLLLVTADEPRTPPPPPVVRQHDVDPWADEYIELFTSPDCWLDYYYQYAVTSSGVTWDARRDLFSGPAQLRFNTNKSIELGIIAKAGKVRGGWTLRILMPRKLLIPPRAAFVRFNARRFRHVQEHKATVAQFYTWAQTRSLDHRPELFGWIILPQ